MEFKLYSQSVGVPSKSDGHIPSLFARMDMQIAYRLFQLAINKLQTSDSLYNGDGVISRRKNSNGFHELFKNGDIKAENLQFLVLSVTPLGDTVGGVTTSYVSYNGGQIGCDNWKHEHQKSSDYIELHPSMVLRETEEVFVEGILNVEDATSLEVEPLTISDWEMLQCHAEYLESAFLNQVSVVFADQVIFLRLANIYRPNYVEVHDTDVIRIKVLRSNFSPQVNLRGEGISSPSMTTPNEDISLEINNLSILSLLPSEFESIKVQHNEENCLRLKKDTTILVKPKSRDTITDPNHSEPLCVSCFETNESNNFIWAHLNLKPEDRPDHGKGNEPLFLLPNCVALHPETLEECVPGWRCKEPKIDIPLALMWRSSSGKCFPFLVDDEKSNTDEPSGLSPVIVRIESSSRIPKFHVGISILTRYRLCVTPLFSHVKLKLLTTKDIQSAYEKGLNLLKDSDFKFQRIQFSFQSTFLEIPSYFMPSEPPTIEPKGHSSLQHKVTFEEIKSTIRNLMDTNRDFNVPISSKNFLSIPFPVTTQSTHDCIGRESIFNFEVVDKENDTKQKELELNAKNESETEIPPLMFLSEIYDILVKRSFTLVNESTIVSLPNNEYMFLLINRTCRYTHGMQKVIEKSWQYVQESTYTFENTIDEWFEPTCGTVMICGDNGTGKTHLALLFSAILQLVYQTSTVYLDCLTLQSSQAHMSKVLDVLTQTYQRGAYFFPSVVILDNLDALLPNLSDTKSVEDNNNITESSFSSHLADQSKIISDHILYLQGAHTKNQERDFGLNKPINIFTGKSVRLMKNYFRPIEPFSFTIKVPHYNHIERTTIFFQMLETNLDNIFINRQERYEPLTFDSMRKFQKKSSISEYFPIQFLKRFSQATEKFSPKDLSLVCSKVIHHVLLESVGRKKADDVTLLLSRDKYITAMDYFNITLTIDWLNLSKIAIDEVHRHVPTAFSSVNLSSNAKKTPWSGVIGLNRAKAALEEYVFMPIKHHEIYRNSPIRLPKGILLFGPSGCGKSYLVPALADECNLNLIRCRGPELLDKYIGASEAKVRRLFEEAVSVAPSILFFDDFEALAPRRGMDNTGVTDRLVNQLLTLIDGVESLSMHTEVENSTVFVVAATSRPDRVDQALLRPGRLEKHIYIGFPGNDDELRNAFCCFSRDRPLSTCARKMLESGSFFHSYHYFRKNRWLYSQADIKAIFDKAHVKSVRAHIGITEGSKLDDVDLGDFVDKEIVIKEFELREAIESSKPSVSSFDFFDMISCYNPYLTVLDKQEMISNIKSCYSEDSNILEWLENLFYSDSSTAPKVQKSALL